MTKLVDMPDLLTKARTFGIFDDFTDDQSDITWVDTITDTGTVTIGDAVGGIVALVPSDGTVADNDEAYIESPNEVFKFAADKPIICEAKVQFTEANTDDANIFFGLMDAIGANSLVDDGAGPKTSYSGAVFYKVDGGTNWWVEASLGATQTAVELTATNSLDKTAKTAGGASYQKLRIEFRPYSSTAADVLYFIDDVHVYKITGFVYTSATEMQVGAGVKNGGANLETLNIDYIGCYQLR